MNHSQHQSSTAHGEGSGNNISPADIILAMDLAASFRYDQWGNPRAPGQVNPPAVHDHVPRYVRPQDVFPAPRPPGRPRTPTQGSLVPSQNALYASGARTPSHGSHALAQRDLPTSERLKTLRPGPRAPVQPQFESTATPPSAARRHARYPIPLPSDTDPKFQVDIHVHGDTGLRLTLDRLRTESPLNQSIARQVVSANLSLDHKIRGNEIWTQPAHFPGETTRMVPRHTPKDPKRGFTVGHLLTLLVQKQHSYWQRFASARNGHVLLKDVVGHASAGTLKEERIDWGAVYAVAIRRRKTNDGTWCYFPQLEIRIQV
ncbi:hypothetical protein FKP32DRAFT_1599696 [Trametes sanguinea]|nr:hypothetical protein FKP32DRAFT_1599696 [Trametes sanguinea]